MGHPCYPDKPHRIYGEEPKKTRAYQTAVEPVFARPVVAVELGEQELEQDSKIIKKVKK
jgi:hypothetical protein